LPEGAGQSAITNSEILNAINGLSNNTACSLHDNILNEYIKYSKDTSTNVAAMHQLRSSVKKKCAHYRYLTKSFLRTSHFLFRLRSSVHYSGCFVNHFNLHNYTYRMHCPWQRGQIVNLKIICFHWCLHGKESNYNTNLTYKTFKCNVTWQ
jgi:hypothetical protein